LKTAIYGKTTDNQESLHKDRRFQNWENLFLIPISGESDPAYFFLANFMGAVVVLALTDDSTLPFGRFFPPPQSASKALSSFFTYF
jgi:hypothetical protein